MRGTAEHVSPSDGSRSICYCDDCQIYALHLGAPGVLDERGGTDACLLAPAQVKLTQGLEHLRCVKLSPKGVFRWYAGCCNTPLGNTIDPRVPLVILVHACMDHAAGGHTRDQDLGPPYMRLMGRFAAGGIPAGVPPKVPLGKMARGMLTHFARTFLRGRSKPSPFLDEQGRPRAEPSLLPVSEREALRARVYAAANLTA
jgi:hypothetical protein